MPAVLLWAHDETVLRIREHVFTTWLSREQSKQEEMPGSPHDLQGHAPIYPGNFQLGIISEGF